MKESQSRAVLAVPTLAAMYPVAHVWLTNFDEITGTDAAITLLIAAIAGGVVHAIVALLSRRRMTRTTIAVVAGLVNVLLFPAVQIAERLPLRFRYGVVLLGIALLLVIAWLWWKGGHRPGWARTAVIATGIGYAALLTAPFEAFSEKRAMRPRLAALTKPIAASASPPASAPPDIYLLLLDTYGSPEVLSSLYGIDEPAFADSLRALGFSLPVTQANYSSTSHALASLLNVTYLDSLGPLFDGGTGLRWPLYDLIHRDRVTEFLASRGYRSFVVPSVAWIGTGRHSRAAVHLTTPRVGLARGTWLRSSLVYSVWPHTLVGRLLPGVPRWSSPERVLAGFEGTMQLIETAGPKFVLMHSMASHFPFTVSADCGARPRDVQGSEVESREALAAYADGVRCTDREVLALVTQILARSERPPVIMIHADHGPRAQGIPWSGNADRVTAMQAIERFDIFGAYFLPGAPPAFLPDTVTPVNVLRRVLTQYLGADLPPLPDRSLHATNTRPYHFYEVPRAVFADSARRLLRQRAMPAVETPPRP